jgi:transcriptional antiterminator RfaH
MPDLRPSPAWYVAEVAAQATQQAQRNLERQGFGSFCPRFRTVRRHARRVDQVLAPVFPGYIFVRFDPTRDQWRSINGTFGIKRLVGPSSGRPQPMPEAAMQALLARCEGEVMKCIAASLSPGQSVRLIAGPFADRLATIEQLGDRDRVRDLLDILGGAVPATVGTGDLSPA